MHIQALILGAGPGGLACANILAKNNIQTLVIERKPTIGPKVCAGGITWSGLSNRVPEDLIERSFRRQRLSSRFQNVTISSEVPIISTVNRVRLGQYMAHQAQENGATILPFHVAKKIQKDSVEVQNRQSGKIQKIDFDYLIGADGSLSLVRRYLKLPMGNNIGIGINYQIPQNHDSMEWHLDSNSFKNGYSWIFPHTDTVSIGAYVRKDLLPAIKLKRNLISWAASNNINLKNEKCFAEYINFDYQGWDFRNIFLVGDAAGFASALTGEGIYPAIVSGETVAKKILTPNYSTKKIDRMIKKQKRFKKVVELTSNSMLLNTTLGELSILLLRSKLLNFRHLEMGH